MGTRSYERLLSFTFKFFIFKLFKEPDCYGDIEWSVDTRHLELYANIVWRHSFYLGNKIQIFNFPRTKKIQHSKLTFIFSIKFIDT